MQKKITGFIKNEGLRVAGRRLRDCEKILNKYGFFFPPLYPGTLNITLEQPFRTPETGCIFISQEEIDQVAPGYAEWWKLIPVISINEKRTTGFILRTKQNCHGDSIVELVTEDLRSWNNINLIQGEKLEITVEIESEHMDDNLKRSLDELANGADMIIANPKDIEKLKGQGLPFYHIPSQTIDQLFKERLSSAMDVAKFLPSSPNNLPPAIKSLYQEIRECILFGLNGAAITLSGNLIEFTLKHTTYVKEVGGYQKYNQSKWDEVENIEFGNAINRAKRAGLLKSEMAKQLHSFREDIRNPYSHYNIKKITEDVIAGRVKKIDLSTGKIEEVDIQAKESPMIQAQAKPWVDKQKVLHVFNFADAVVKYLISKLNE